jgi:2-(1,2-epoxy-1,2-dihydrophenyl)acetyl-CoA isomerase
MYTNVLFDLADSGLARVRLNRPGAGNAIDLTTAGELADVATRLGEDRRVRAVLLTGSGPRFCVGGDLKSFAAVDPEERPSHIKAVASAFHVAVARLAGAPFPVVAAVQGAAAGAGFSLACSCDLVIAAASARFVFAYGAAGLSPDGSATWFLPRLIGLRRSFELALTGRTLSSSEAEAWGLISRCVPADELVSEAERLGAALAAGPTRAFAATRDLLRTSLDTTLETQLEREASALARTARTADAREGITAFVERRAATFGGS